MVGVLSVSLFPYLSVSFATCFCLSMYLLIHRSNDPCTQASINLSINRSVHLFVYPCISFSICVSTYLLH